MVKKYFLVLPLFYLSIDATAGVFFVDPVHGSMSNDGSAASPWKTLEEVFENNLIETQSYSPLPYSENSILVPKNAGAPVKSGDTLMLRDGYHGTIFYRGIYNNDYITIMNQSGHEPMLGNIFISAGSRFIFDGLTITPEAAPSFFYSQLFRLESHGYHGPSREVIVRNCQLRGISDASGWGLKEWNSVGSCIKIDGNASTVENCHCLNIDEGINISADSCIVSGNSIVNFAGDGMRGQGSYLLFEYNLVKNCYDIDDNHDDGFQAFTSPGYPLVGNVLRGNVILNWEDPDQPFRGTLQGIGCFDGPYVDWIIENNIVAVNHYHGISLYGAENCRIINNSVIDLDSVNGPNGTWIMVNDHKNGTPSSGCVIQNNLSFGFSYGQETDFLNNLLIAGYQNFVNASAVDFHLKPGSDAIDMGYNQGAPPIDIERNPRPVGGVVDVGAYEFQGLPPCTENTMTLSGIYLGSEAHQIKQWLSTSGIVTIKASASQLFTVGSHAEFSSGFEVENNAIFEIRNGDCALSP
ncbi:MAG: right-handed parallel beta-helix repeat-containing protein [Saprospiraceae bacterium]|nr:right-handed parallel beta-helix repeat-containing protein [Saprospiraceae bacterium]